MCFLTMDTKMPNTVPLSAKVYDLLPVKELHGYVYGPNVHLEEPLWNCMTVEPIVRDGITYVPVMGENEEDTYSILKVSPPGLVREWCGRMIENA